ncbi:MAG: hypothetical protein GF307_00165 [candidate division Zixibacteria bacterium]|nr:hypothetical protein [candidate division Zixibacteria bacterium]
MINIRRISPVLTALAVLISAVCFSTVYALDTADNFQWEPVGPEGGCAYSFYQNPDNLSEIIMGMSGEPGTVFRSVNFGDSWENTGTTKGEVYKVAVDPIDSDIMYTLGGEGISKTTDGGLSWEWFNFAEDPGETQYFAREGMLIDYQNTDIIYAVGYYLTEFNNYRGTIFKSIDAGETWEAIFLGPVMDYATATAIAIDPDDHNTLYAGAFGMLGGGSVVKVLKTTDGWASWDDITGTVNINPDAILIDPVDPSQLYIPTGQLVFRSTNYGQSWSRAQNWNFSSVLTIDPNNPQNLYSAGVNLCGRSTNYGVNWELTYELTHGKPNQIGISGDGELIIGSYFGVFVSDDNGYNWEEAVSGLTATTINTMAVSPSNPDVIYTYTGGYSLKRTMDGGLSWEDIMGPEICHSFEAIKINPYDINTIYVIGGP